MSYVYVISSNNHYFSRVKRTFRYKHLFVSLGVTLKALRRVVVASYNW